MAMMIFLTRFTIITITPASVYHLGPFFSLLSIVSPVPFLSCLSCVLHHLCLTDISIFSASFVPSIISLLSPPITIAPSSPQSPLSSSDTSASSLPFHHLCFSSHPPSFLSLMFSYAISASPVPLHYFSPIPFHHISSSLHYFCFSRSLASIFF